MVFRVIRVAAIGPVIPRVTSTVHSAHYMVGFCGAHCIVLVAYYLFITSRDAAIFIIYHSLFIIYIVSCVPMVSEMLEYMWEAAETAAAAKTIIYPHLLFLFLSVESGLCADTSLALITSIYMYIFGLQQ